MRIPRCKVCGEETMADTTSSLFGLVHKYGPVEHGAFVSDAPDHAKREARNRARLIRHAVLTDLGLKRVKGVLGGTYYE